MGILVPLIVLIFIVSSCSNNRHKVDLSGIEVKVELKRFDQKQRAAEGMTWFSEMREFDPDFCQLFLNNIIGDITGAGALATEEEMAQNYAAFLLHDDVQDLHAKVKQEFADMSAFEEELSQALKYFRYHFPERNLPDFITFIAPFRAAHPYTDSIVGIGLDMYLGEDYEPYYRAPMNFPNYLVRKLDRKYMLANTLQAMAAASFDEHMNQQRLLDEMIAEGKRLYFIDALCPDLPDSLKIGYFKGQIEWSQENEYQIWEHMVSSGMLYNTDKNYYIRYLNDGPFTVAKGVPQDAPPRIGAWLGWQIVRAYMTRNAEVHLSQLMQEHDADKILKESAYRP